MNAPHPPPDIDPSRVVGALSSPQVQALRAIVGREQVLLDHKARAKYAADESPIAPVLPAAVVRVRSAEDVAAVLEFADRERIPVTPRGAGTGKVGGAVPLYGGIVLSLERMDHLLEIDTANRLARAEPGLVTGRLHEEVMARGLYYPPDPNSLDTCSIGGNVATNAAGPCSMKYGATRAHVLGLQVVLAGGRRLTVGRRTTKSTTGYDLTSLIVGSEGTLAVVVEVTVRLTPHPGDRKTLFVPFSSASEAVGSLVALHRAGVVPAAAEFFDRHALEAMSNVVPIPARAEAALLFEVHGTPAVLEATLERFAEVLGPRSLEVAVAGDGEGLRRLWAARKEVSVLIKERFRWRRSEDIAVPPGRLPRIVDFLESLRARTDLHIVAYGHAGDGNLHVNFLYQEDERHDEVERAAAALFHETIALGGTLSGEHGIGATKRRFLGLEQTGALISVQKQLKRSLDPHDIMNPGKVFP